MPVFHQIELNWAGEEGNDGYHEEYEVQGRSQSSYLIATVVFKTFHIMLFYGPMTFFIIQIHFEFRFLLWYQF